MEQRKPKDRSLILAIGMFAIPVALSTLIQRLFNVIDTMMAGKFVGTDALAAVGSTGTITGVILGLGMGYSMGANILVGKAFGEKKHEKLKDIVHLAVLLAIVIGTVSCAMGIVFARQLLLWMNTPEDILDQAILYMRIYCLGMPGLLVYNTGGAILRGQGDSQSPLYVLIISGIANIIIKIVLVVLFDTGIVGLAAATMLTQYISAVCVMFLVARSKVAYRFTIQKHIRLEYLKELSVIGLTGMIEGIFFDVGNLLFQSSLNTFGSGAIAGNSVAGQVEALVYVTMNCFYFAALSFTSQSFGAGEYKKIRRIVWICNGYVMAAWCFFGGLAYGFRIPLSRLFTDDPVAMEYALLRLAVVLPFYFSCGLQEVFRASLRGMNHSVLVTVGSLLFVCIFRVGWICTAFQKIRSFQMLMFAMPFSYLSAAVGFAVIFALLIRRRLRVDNKEM